MDYSRGGPCGYPKAYAITIERQGASDRVGELTAADIGCDWLDSVRLVDPIASNRQAAFLSHKPSRTRLARATYAVELTLLFR